MSPSSQTGTPRIDALPRVGRSCRCLRREGVYVGWDGRLLKIGVSVGKDGVAQRMRPYRTCNPLFGLIAVLPMPREVAFELERIESRLLTHLAESAFRLEDEETEWLLPSEEVATFAERASRFHAALPCGQPSIEAIGFAFRFANEPPTDALVAATRAFVEGVAPGPNRHLSQLRARLGNDEVAVLDALGAKS
jgi:hypothetical protein